jgi:chaperonin cofactor prefoldin
MFKAEPGILKKELERKKQILDLRVKAIEKQEQDIRERVTKIRDEIVRGMK